MAESTFNPGDAVTVVDESLVFAGRTGEVVGVDRESGDVTVAVPRHVEIEGVPMEAAPQHIRYPATALAPATVEETELHTDPGGGQPKQGIEVPADGVERETTLEGAPEPDENA